MANTYNENDIKVLTGLDGVRYRSQMYIGSLQTGQFHILKEILDNAIDECIASKTKKIGCIITDQYFEVFDQGRGIPVGIHPDFQKEKISTLQLIFTHLHAGGKLEEGAYEQSTGTHGVGGSCTNALSSYFQVWTYRDRTWWTQSYSKGIPTSKVIKQKPQGDYKKGTVIRFTPDSEILKTPLDKKMVITWMRNSCFLNPGVEFYLKIGDKEKTYKSEGLTDYIKYITKDLDCEPLYKPFIARTANVDVVLQWLETDESNLNSWCNSSPTIEGGTHLKGLLTVINKGFDALVKKKTYKPEDLRVGLYGAINVKINQPQFDSQTKEKLMNPQAEKIVIEQVYRLFEKYLQSNKQFVKKVTDRASSLRNIYETFSKQKKALGKPKKRGRANLPPAGKFLESNCKEIEQKELFIVEGDSAGGTARGARNPHFQEILKLRGKILNIAKKSLIKAYESEDIVNILKAVGFNPEDKTNQLRVGKVIILTDADVDGAHIAILLVTLFEKLYPELLQQGRVYRVDAPLFIGKAKNKEYYGESLQDIINQAGGKLETVSRLKGWGEVDADLLKKFAFDPTTRKLIQIQSVEGSQLKYFHKIVGEDTETRKTLLRQG